MNKFKQCSIVFFILFLLISLNIKITKASEHVSDCFFDFDQLTSEQQSKKIFGYGPYWETDPLWNANAWSDNNIYVKNKMIQIDSKFTMDSGHKGRKGYIYVNLTPGLDISNKDNRIIKADLKLDSAVESGNMLASIWILDRIDGGSKYKWYKSIDYQISGNQINQLIFDLNNPDHFTNSNNLMLTFNDIKKNSLKNIIKVGIQLFANKSYNGKIFLDNIMIGGKEKKNFTNLNKGFVKKKNANFELNNVPYRFAGANTYYLFYKSHYMIDDVLQTAKRNNVKVIRTWGFSDGKAKYAKDNDNNTANGNEGSSFQPEPELYYEPTFVNFDYIIKAAGEAGIRLIIPLINYWSDIDFETDRINSYGGMGQYLEWCSIDPEYKNGEIINKDIFYSNECTKNLYKSYVNHFINRVNSLTGIPYKDDPTILAWELSNELRGNYYNQEYCQNNEIYNWIKEMSSFVKSIDPNHLLGIGDEGFLNQSNSRDDLYNGSFGVDWEKNLSIQSIDFGTVHLYPEAWERDYEWANSWIKDHIKIAQKHEQPVIIEEFGVNNQEVRNEVYQQWANLFENFLGIGVDGDLVWMLGGKVNGFNEENYSIGDFPYYPDYDKYTFWEPSKTMNVIKNHSGQMSSSSLNNQIISYGLESIDTIQMAYNYHTNQNNIIFTKKNGKKRELCFYSKKQGIMKIANCYVFNCPISIAINPEDGVPAVAYRDPDKNLMFAKLSKDTWKSFKICNWGWNCSLAFDPTDNHPAIAFNSTGDYNLYYAKGDDDDWYIDRLSWDDACLVSLKFNPLTYEKAISFKTLGWTNHPSRLAYYGDGYIDGVPNYVGGGNSLAFDSSGNPHITYFDHTKNYLNHTWKINSKWNKQVIDSNADGSFTSLAIDKNNIQHVSYVKQTSSGKYLKYATNDGGLWKNNIIVKSSNMSPWSALTINDQGKINIAYISDGQLCLFKPSQDDNKIIIHEHFNDFVSVPPYGNIPKGWEQLGSDKVSYSKNGQTNGYLNAIVKYDPKYYAVLKKSFFAEPNTVVNIKVNVKADTERNAYFDIGTAIGKNSYQYKRFVFYSTNQTAKNWRTIQLEKVKIPDDEEFMVIFRFSHNAYSGKSSFDIDDLIIEKNTMGLKCLRSSSINSSSFDTASTYQNATIEDLNKKTAEIILTDLPPIGNRIKNLKGEIINAIPAEYHIAVYIYQSGWWSKNKVSVKQSIEQNSIYFDCDITTSANDHKATKIGVFLLPADKIIPVLKGDKELPHSLFANAAASIIKKRDSNGWEYNLKK